jgi:RND superfamily putative drug exporter
MEPTRSNSSLAARAGRWSARNKKKAFFGWLAFVAIAFMLGNAAGMKTLEEEDQGSGEQARAEQIYNDAFPDEPAEESVLVQAKKNGDATVLTAATKDVRDTVAGFDGVKMRKTDTSKDGRSQLVNFELTGTDEVAQEKLITEIMVATGKTADRHRQVEVGHFGSASAGKALDESFEKDFQKAESLSLPLTLAILLIAFGALVAAAVPVLLALSAVGSSLGLVAVASQVVPMDEAVNSVVLLIGLAVGVDYSLFYLRREREEKAKGRKSLEAIDIAAATSGRAVLISGLTVMVAMAGMFFTGQATFVSFAVGTIIVVAVAMLGSLTVLPATLSMLGDRVEKGRIPLLGRLRRTSGESRVWNAVLTPVLKRPLVSFVAATALLLALASPALDLKVANSGMDDLPRDLAVMQTYDKMQQAFPGGQIPASVVVKADDVTTPAVQQGMKELEQAAFATKTMNGPTNVEVSPDRTVAMLSIPIQGNGTDAKSERALELLRQDVIPSTIKQADGVEDAAVTGVTAGSKDFTDLMVSRAPIVFAFVLGLAFVLLLIEFRSIVIPAKAIVLNLLSVAAAYGVLVAVFQNGVGAELLGVDEATQGAIVSWLPMFLFVILFGLSMDYHVFILSRVREAYDNGMSSEDAVAHGIKTTAGVVTSAAFIMVAVFSVFGTLSFVDMKQMGVGLAVAVLIDATIIRGVLLPATMKLLGDWNWYLPKWMPLQRAPRRRPVLETA